MNKFLLIGAAFCAIFMTQNINAQSYDDAAGCPPNNCEQPCPPQDQPCGDCWCLYCHYEPCYYTTCRCVDEPVYCTKRCCRYVPKNYQVQRCRYVPQYYTQTCCRYEPEYYDVCECKTCKKWIPEKKCTYVPKYYYKRVCNPQCNTGSPAPAG